MNTVVMNPGGNPWPRVNVILAIAVLAVIEIALIFDGPTEYPAVGFGNTALAVIYSTAGILLSRRRPLNRTGGILIFGGIAWFVAGLGYTGIPALIAIGQCFATLPVVATLHLMFVFPNGQTRSRLDRLALGTMYFSATVLQLPVVFFAEHPSPYDVLSISQNQGLSEALNAVRIGLTWLVMVAIIANLYRRYRGAAPYFRHAYRPFVAYVTIVLIGSPVIDRLLGLMFDLTEGDSHLIYLAVMAGVPLAAIAVARRGGFAAVSEPERVVGELADGFNLGDLEAALARAIGDPTVRIGIGDGGSDSGFTGVDGALLNLPGEEGERGLHAVRFHGRQLGVITFDLTVAGPAEVDAAATVAAGWFEQIRLQEALASGEEELQRTYRRVMESADGERRRIAQDLHDGLSSRLVLLAIKVQRVASDGGADEALRQQVESLKGEVDETITALRSLVHELMPSELIESGIVAAVERLVAELPFDAAFEASGELDDLSPATERTIYLATAEAINNVVRHSEADEAKVCLSEEGGAVILRVSDDGVGGAEVGRGNGLTGIARRAESMGGSLAVESPPGAGTCITAVFRLDA